MIQFRLKKHIFIFIMNPSQYSNITFERSRESAVSENGVRKQAFERFTEWFVSLMREFLTSIEELFAYSEQEWIPLKDSQFQEILEHIRKSHLQCFVLPEDYVLGKKSPEKLTRQERKALLDRVKEVKRDFYHSCMDNVSGIPSNLDGNTAGNSLLAFLFDLHYLKKDHPDDTSLHEMIKTFSETYKFVVEREAVERLVNKKEQAFRKQEYIGKVEAKLRSLNPGERFVYQMSVSHHAVLFEFKLKEVEGKQVLDIKLLNSGDGVDHHYSKSFFADLNPFAKFQTYLIEGVEKDTFLSSDFVSKLIELEVPGEVKGRHIPVFGYLFSLVDSIHHMFFGVGKIYRLLNVHAIHDGCGKKVISDDPRLHHYTQSKGTCSRRIYEYWMRENLASDSEFQNYLAKTAEYGVARLKMAEALENHLKGRSVKVDSLKDRLFVQPHWFSKGVACLRNSLKTRTMILIGEKIVQKRQSGSLDC